MTDQEWEELVAEVVRQVAAGLITEEEAVEALVKGYSR
jgi:hypothetical protein